LEWIEYPLFEEAFYQDPHPKDAIFIRHTDGHFRPDWVIDSWGRDRKNSTNKIRSGSAFVIGGSNLGKKPEAKFNGKIYRAFDPEMWSHHLFIKSKSNTFLNQKSIGIELCNYGELIKTANGDFYTKTNIKVPKKDVVTLESSFRGATYFHAYTNEQIESLRDLIIYLGEEFEINIKRGIKKEIEALGAYAGFELSETALHGGQGLWSHSNVRVDRLSCYPHPDLIKVINSF